MKLKLGRPILSLCLLALMYSTFARANEAVLCHDIFTKSTTEGFVQKIKNSMNQGLLSEQRIEFRHEYNNLDVIFPNRITGLVHPYDRSADQSEVMVGESKLQLKHSLENKKPAQLVITSSDGSSKVIKTFDDYDIQERDRMARRIRLIKSGDDILMIAPGVNEKVPAADHSSYFVTYIYKLEAPKLKSKKWNINLYSKLRTESDFAGERTGFNEFVPIGPGLFLNAFYTGGFPNFSLIEINEGKSEQVHLAQFERHYAYGAPVAVSGKLGTDGLLHVGMISRQESGPSNLSEQELGRRRQNNSSLLGNGGRFFDSTNLTFEITGSFDLNTVANSSGN